LAELIAWFIAEGNVSGNAINFSLGSHETTFAQRIQDCLAALKRESTVKISGSVIIVNCNDVTLADFLMVNCGCLAPYKRIPLSLISGHERLVFDTLVDGDGHIKSPDLRGPNRRRAYMYTTVSETLAMQVQLLGASLGLAGAYTTRPSGQAIIEGRTVNCRESYSVELQETTLYDVQKRNYKLRSAKNGMLGQVRSVTTEFYSGPVHNISVLCDESYVVNNRAVHNCSWEASNRGAYYAKQIAELRANGRITYDDLYRPDLLTHCCFDIGRNDATAIWWFQIILDPITREHNVNFIDFECNVGTGLAETAEIVRLREQNFGYKRGKLIMPHDIRVHEWGAQVDRLSLARQAGMLCVQCPPHTLEDGIEIVRRHLPQCRFDARKCEDGIESLAQYKAKLDKYDNAIGPLHDKNSDPADSLRYGIAYVFQVMCKPQLMMIPKLRQR
jgi:hypothetical protein